MSGPEVTLQVGSQIHRGWKGVQAQLSLQQLSGSFNINATDTWVENGKPAGRRILGMEKCVLRIGGETVITGLVDDAVPFYRAGDVGLRVQGRDRTALLADCSTDKREFQGQTLAGIAAALCKDFGIPVRVVNFDGGKPFTRFTVDAGSTYARAIEDGCRQVGAMMWTDGTGTLLIGRPAATINVGTLRLGDHILEGEAGNSFADRFSRIKVASNKSGDDLWSNAGAVPQGVATDPDIGIFKPMVLTAEAQAEGAATPSERAAWEVSVRRARSKTTRIKVQGWLSPNGMLYRPGYALDIEDARLGRHGTLVIADVSFVKDNNGTTAQLTLLPEKAFVVLAEGQSSGKKDGGLWS